MTRSICATILAAAVCVSAGCSDYLDVNTNPNAPQTVTANLYLPPMEHWMVTAPEYDGRYVGGYTQEWISTSGSANGVGLTYQQAWGRMGYDPGSDNGAEQDDENPVAWIVEPADVDRASQQVRLGNGRRIAAPQKQRHIGDDEDKAEGQERLAQWIASHRTQKHVHDHADYEHDERRAERPGREAIERSHDAERNVGTDQVKGAVRQIGHTQDAKRDRQAGRDEEQQHSEGNAVENLSEPVCHARLIGEPSGGRTRSCASTKHPGVVVAAADTEVGIHAIFA